MDRFMATNALILQSGAAEQNADMKRTELNAKYFSLGYWEFYYLVYYMTIELINMVAMKFNVSREVTPYSLVEI